jgi:hypothetical protein
MRRRTGYLSTKRCRMTLREMIRAARAKPMNHRADMVEALVLAGIGLFVVGVMVGIGIAR